MKNTKTITTEQKETFDFLNELREEGSVNMFGAWSYIQSEFGFDRKKSNEIVKDWMLNFNSDGYDHLEIA